MIISQETRGLGRGYWHQYGTQASDPTEPATVIAERAKMNYLVEKRPLMTLTSKGEPIEIADQFAVVSNHDNAENVIAVVGKQFEPVQNAHLAEMLDASGLTGPNGVYGVDTAGVSKDGRLAFWALRAPESTTIAGDEYRDHWILIDGKDGHRAVTFALTPVRVVCSNAIAASVAGASVKVGIQHTQGAGEELKFWLGIAPKLLVASQRSKEMLTRLSRISVTEEMIDDVLSATYPAPRVNGRARLFADLPTLQLNGEHSQTVERAMSRHEMRELRVLARRQVVRDLFISYADNAEEKNIAGTLLGIVNAVADVETHRESSTKREDVLTANIDGDRFDAQKRAISKALTLV